MKAVDRVNLLVDHGEVFGLLGPNGAGKTTTAGILTTRVLPTSGQAFVGDVDVVKHPTVAKQLIGVVPQNNTLDRSLTVWENLYFHGRYFGMNAKESRIAAQDVLAKFRLTERVQAPVMSLSGGLAQRLMIARAVLHRPAILFLDEPTSGLDPQGRIAMWELIRGLGGAGQTVLLTTHNMEEADVLCDRIGIMDRGTILTTGTPQELKRGVADATVITLSALGDLEGLAKLLRERVEGVQSAVVANDRVHLHVRGTEGLLVRAIESADGGGYHVTDIAVTEPTLETVFINLTGKDLRD
ncbi:MAG: ATP-binding cassette domain-containing protein [Candidatus Dormibacteria bacterium]